MVNELEKPPWELQRFRAGSWTPEIMAGAILALKMDGQPVNSKYLRAHNSNLLHRMEESPFGWRGIVKLAGFDPQVEAKGSFGPRKIYTYVKS
ncbi:hypothetical protein A3A54_02670 [Candidatus Curtissbacteria bacterium RIFCSPLOWO2_01_FULL_39_62]|uniref:Uncharacterized protein n=2 Tax=Candidatus Curtissiibacteriota TaxID=1752717 RepID=A0A1F5GBM5_9BACT|nr:MAG: hypothetical protein A2775_01820 [Candidatus Curtissbacteria bacterium RIFCSPHIGHO2_01_FULL_39_57]OGD89249.1 MAG: hypothetical protein A3D04_01270 [Candidatus Curtissbacteria bacterium RIFCSPHIGHO2_02_FULL_40_16b]OGE01446.1 MAG: hypothetical protein A3A54_02670 [Candidatus Curtissbacteria bacterium RIFCSPLOWO2_01_FULL_39_62]OGE13942.1 MAG: hypothetical protein A3G14_04975 [Candidatus Curtissbacteria bacterium RIFCSPLOWO2_12_FULL_38_9]